MCCILFVVVIVVVVLVGGSVNVGRSFLLVRGKCAAKESLPGLQFPLPWRHGNDPQTLQSLDFEISEGMDEVYI
jgi:hypothetical protein